MKSALPLFLFILICLQGAVFAEFRTFENDFGDKVEAQLIELKDSETVVTLRLRSGLEIDAMLSAFSQQDKKFILEWWGEVVAEKQLLREDSRLNVSAKMNRKSKDGQYSWHNRVDDETVSFYPEILIENEELETFSGNQVRVVIVAEDKRNEGQKLIVSAATKEVNLPRQSTTSLETDPFRLRLYEYSRSGGRDYAYGYEYEGYVVVIKNARGEVTHQRASKRKYLTNMKVIMECKAGEMYDETLDYKLKVRPNSYYVQ